MNLEKNQEQAFELIPSGGGRGKLLKKKRLLVGRSQTCDIIISSRDVSAIHAVIEVKKNSIKIYDMDSTNGTYHGDTRIVSHEIEVGQSVRFAKTEFSLKRVGEDSNFEVAPLDMLQPIVASETNSSHLPPVTEIKNEIPEVKDIAPPVSKIESVENEIIESTQSENIDSVKNVTEVAAPVEKETRQVQETGQAKELPKEKPTFSQSKSEEKIPEPNVPRVEFPLENDPKADYTDYIFETTEELYPIFKYDFAKSAVELIILFKDKIHSVDYIPDKDGVYRLAGFSPKGEDIEYAYMGKKDKFDFIDRKGGTTTVNPLPGYDFIHIGDGPQKNNSMSLNLDENDIFRFRKDDLEIYVRSTEAPPKIAPAPVLRRDPEFKKYLLFVMFFITLFFGAVTSLTVDEEKKKEKDPERIATILYKKRRKISKQKAVAKTKTAPKKVVQKSPKKKVEKPKAKPKTVKAKGTKTPKVGKVKKATPNKAAKTVKKDVVRPKKSTAKAKVAKSKPRRRARNNLKTAGPVDTYKAVNFNSTISKLLAKGGSTSSRVKVAAGSGSAAGTSGLSSGSPGATLKSATVSNQTGSLSGAASGTLDATRGAEGIVNKKSIYTAGFSSPRVVRGGMDPNLIRQILMDHLPQFRYCYQSVLDKSNSKFDGRVGMNFLIGASGRVTRAAIKSVSTAVPPKVNNCMVNVLKGIKFPSPPGGGVVEVNQPFGLKSSGR